MAITDISISEELMTNAPSIKYRGEEGPKSPEEEMMMADALLKEEYEKYVYDLLEQRPEATPMSLDEFRRMVIGDMSGGQPLPQDPTKPVNPFQPKPQGPPLPDRQMAAYGGIMGVDGRRQYGIGSSLKKFVRKVIPNEVAEVAVKAAPFVAPFNAPLAAAMSGLGSFDQTGRIGSSLKAGLGTYAQGKIMSGLGGGGYQSGKTLNPFSRDFYTQFSSPIGTKSGLGKMFKENFTDKLSTSGGSMIEGVNEAELQKIVDAAADKNLTPEKLLSKKANETFIKNTQAKNLSLLDKAKDYAMNNKLATFLLAKEGVDLLSGGPEKVVSEIMDRGESLDVESIRAEVTEAFKDPSGNKLAALRVKYPYLGRADTKDIANMAMGGRAGFAEGGIMDLGGMEKDYRAEGGFVPIGKEEKADDVPARLSVNEFVFTADAVRNAGGGDIDKGAEVMENMMKNLEAGGQVSEESQGMAGAQKMFETSERLSEVI
jgi:hypothetical protein